MKRFAFILGLAILSGFGWTAPARAQDETTKKDKTFAHGRILGGQYNQAKSIAGLVGGIGTPFGPFSGLGLVIRATAVVPVGETTVALDSAVGLVGCGVVFQPAERISQRLGRTTQ